MHPVRIWYLWRSEASFRFPGTGITDCYEPPWGCWEPNPGPPVAASALSCGAASPAPEGTKQPDCSMWSKRLPAPASFPQP